MGELLLVKSLREQVAVRLRNDVLCGRLVEGERISELNLSRRFGVSRTPIREALCQLTQEGLLEGRPNLGVTVARRPPDAVRELVVPIRRTVETFALRSFFAAITAADLAGWKAILEAMRASCVARDFAAIAEHDIAFHRAIVQRAGERELDAIWESLLARVRSHFWATQRRDYADPLEIYREHARILKAFQSGDVEAAAAALERNIT
jgi:DNA-binding GntR family transcriptional regulator